MRDLILVSGARHLLVSAGNKSYRYSIWTLNLIRIPHGRQALLCGPAVFQLRYATDAEAAQCDAHRKAASESGWRAEEVELAAAVRGLDRDAHGRAEPKNRAR